MILNVVEAVYRKGPWSIACSCPAPSSIESEALVGDDSENTPSSECFGIRLSLDLQDIQRKKNDLAYADQTVWNQQRNLQQYSSLS